MSTHRIIRQRVLHSEFLDLYNPPLEGDYERTTPFIRFFCLITLSDPHTSESFGVVWGIKNTWKHHQSSAEATWSHRNPPSPGFVFFLTEEPTRDSEDSVKETLWLFSLMLGVSTTLLNRGMIYIQNSNQFLRIPINQPVQWKNFVALLFVIHIFPILVITESLPKDSAQRSSGISVWLQRAGCRIDRIEGIDVISYSPEV